MKTASKFLSMLLLVALCLSLMGGSAYALAPLNEGTGDGFQILPPNDNEVPGVGDNYIENNGGNGLAALDPEVITSDVNLETGIMPLTAVDNVWNGLYPDLATAVNAVGAGSSLSLKADASENGVAINKSLVIDLGGHTLTLNGALSINANVTIQNGKIVNAGNVVVASGCTLSLKGVTDSSNNSIVSSIITNGTGKVSEIKDCVAQIGSESFETVQAALNYAANQPGAVTINFPNDTSKLANLTGWSWPSFMSCSSLTLNLNANCLEGDSIEAPVPTTINGGSVKANIWSSNQNVTLNNTTVSGTVGMTGGTLTVNGASVNQVTLTGATLSMASGTINDLIVTDNSNNSTLKVSGGYVKNFAVSDATKAPNRAVTGGEWTIAAGSLEYFKNAIANGYSLKGSSNPYTVGNGSGTVNPGTPGVDGNYYYNVIGSPYTRNSNGSVYVELSSLSSTNYWISTDYNANGATIISSGNYTLTNYSNGIYNYRLTFNNSYLNSLSNGTYYLFGQDGNKNTVRLGSFTVQGEGSTVIPGTAAVWPVDNIWYSGSGMYYFYVTPSLQLVSGGTYDYYDVKIDGMQIGGDKISYNGYQKFGVASSVMDTLATGTHSITVQTTAGTATGSFRVGATLRPVDTDKHVIGSSKNLQFVCSDSISRVWVGPTELTSLNYGDYWTLSSSGKTITLTAKFLNNLSAGSTRTLTVLTANGDQPSCSFQILTTAQASSSPRTGDESNLALWAAVLLLSGGAAVAILPRLKKHED